MDDGAAARGHHPATRAPIVESLSGAARYHLTLGQTGERHTLQ
jgi:hypothetical protein